MDSLLAGGALILGLSAGTLILSAYSKFKKGYYSSGAFRISIASVLFIISGILIGIGICRVIQF